MNSGVSQAVFLSSVQYDFANSVNTFPSTSPPTLLWKLPKYFSISLWILPSQVLLYVLRVQQVRPPLRSAVHVLRRNIISQLRSEAQPLLNIRKIYKQAGRKRERPHRRHVDDFAPDILHFTVVFAALRTSHNQSLHPISRNRSHLSQQLNHRFHRLVRVRLLLYNGALLLTRCVRPRCRCRQQCAHNTPY